MTLHDPFAAMNYGWDWHIRRSRTRHGPGRRRRKPAGPAARVRVPSRRKLAAIERTLAADAPALSSKFALFNHLTQGERPVGAERVSALGRRWTRPRPAVAILLALAAIVALCVTLTTQVDTMVRPCRTSATAGAAATAPVPGLSCHAYAGTRQ
jgi:hypothetical protein